MVQFILVVIVLVVIFNIIFLVLEAIAYLLFGALCLIGVGLIAYALYYFLYGKKKSQAEDEANEKRRQLAEEGQRLAEEKRRAKQSRIDLQEEERLAKKRKKEEERLRLLNIKYEKEQARLLKIATSSTNIIKGRRIINQIRMINISDETDKVVAEHKFLLAIESAGGNGVINMNVRHHKGGFISIQGDAVLLEL